MTRRFVRRPPLPVTIQLFRLLDPGNRGWQLGVEPGRGQPVCASSMTAAEAMLRSVAVRWSLPENLVTGSVAARQFQPFHL